MKKILYVALREFLATVATKGFFIGIVLLPLIILISVFGISRLIQNDQPPKISGEVAVIDPTGEVVDGLREYLKPEAMAKRWEESRRELFEETPEGIRRLTAGKLYGNSRESLKMILGEVPDLNVTRLDKGTDLNLAKELLTAVTDQDIARRLALVIIHDNAVIRKEGEKSFGKYDLFIREKLDDRIEQEIKNGLRDAIVGARIRLQAMDREYIESLTRVESVTSTTVTSKGEQATRGVLNIFLPFGFLILLGISVMSSGQYILTTTVEEKSNRVVEVLLSAVSPMELMTGKILGQMCVGFLILVIYAGMGIYALAVFAMLGVLKLTMLIYMVFFYLIAFFIIGSFMAAIGAAVNEMREAQTFMTPVMLVLMLPWFLWMPISRNPDSLLSMVLSFLPPVNCFVMLLRMSSTAPPPWWQVWISIALGLAAVYGMLWFAGKIFRIGLLMFGKPPDFKTLIRWVRMA